MCWDAQATSAAPTRSYGILSPTDKGISSRQGMLYNWRFTQGNWEGSGYDVLAISPTFPNQMGWHNQQQTVPWWGIGNGQLTVHYHDTSHDFWALVATHLPIAIMSFSRGGNDDKVWELEQWARNLKKDDWDVQETWFTFAGVQQSQGYAPPHAGGSADDSSPYRNQGPIQDSPPDKSRPAHALIGGLVQAAARESSLPLAAIETKLNSVFTPTQLIATIDGTGDVGAFLSEYMAYHVAWYSDYSINVKYPNDPSKQCLRAGHTHVGRQISLINAVAAVEYQLRELIDVLP